MTQETAIARFRLLHASGCFVLPNPWDVGSAIWLEHMGFQALATTSAGFAFSRGLPDEVTAIPLDLMLEHVRDVTHATALPVNADFQTGYADDPADVAVNVARCLSMGVAGLSIEDATGSETEPLYEQGLAVERIRAARAAIDASGLPAVLTARSEAWLVGHPEAARVARERLVAFAEAGADCLYAPGVREPAEIAALVKAVAPRPLNVLVYAGNASLTVAQLTDLGVRRISVGAALARVAWGAFLRAARDIQGTGSFRSLAEGARSPEPDGVFAERARH